MTLPLTAGPGTISIAANSTAVIGTGTAFTTANQGALIIADGFIGQFASDPADDTDATLVIAPTAAIANASYILVPLSGAVVQAQRVRQLLETMAAIPTMTGQIGAAAETGLAAGDESGWVQAASGSLIKRTWANIQAQLATVFLALTGGDLTGPLTITGDLDVNGAISALLGQEIIRDIHTSGALTTFGREYSSGGPVVGYGVDPSPSARGSFVSSTTLALGRAALLLAADTFALYVGGTQTVATGSPASLAEMWSVNPITGIQSLTAGIQFPATENPSSGANVLDDYEEGTFSGAISTSIGTLGGASLSTPGYRKVGNFADVWGTITNITAGTAGGYMSIPLPFTAANNGAGSAREISQTGFAGSLQVSGGLAVFYLTAYDNSTFAKTGNQVQFGLGEQTSA